MGGTHQGDLLGVPPTGKETGVQARHIDRLSGCPFVEERGHPELYGPLQQIGGVPT